jgi:hypothetical protein
VSPEVLLRAAIQTALFFGVGHVVVDLMRARIGRGEELSRRIGWPERWLLACLGFAVWATVLMVAHIATRGGVFSNGWAVPGVTAILVVVWFRYGDRAWSRPQARRVLLIVTAALVLLAIYALPAIRGGSSLRTGDAPWHLGWTEQLLGGEPVPVGPAPDFTANAYPWGLHTVSATQVRLVPGSDPMTSLEAMHLILIAAIPMAAACLARLVNRRAGWAAAATASLIGGFGWIEAGAPDFVASPSKARYGADLVVASPNSVYELLPPALPRELGLVLLACAAVLLAAALNERTIRTAIVAGVAIGAVGLVSVPMMLSAVVWAGAVLVAHRANDRRTIAIVAAAIVTFALWALPVAIDYIRYDGFVSVSPRLGVEWPLVTALGAWGLLLPLALGGAIVLLTQPPIVRRELIAFCIAAVALLALALARGAFDWGVLGNETLLHQGRFWPPAHLLGSALAGLALAALYGWVRAPGLVVAGIVLAAAVVSPVFASIDLTRTIQGGRSGFLYGSEDLSEGSLVRRAAAYLGPDDVIRAENDERLLTFYLFQFSGVRIAVNSQTAPEENPWRIRFSGLAERWTASENATGFHADYVLTTRGPHPDSFVRGEFRGEDWEMFSTINLVP